MATKKVFALSVRGFDMRKRIYSSIIRGATALLVAVATPRLPRRSEAKLLQFVSINAHATWLSRSRAMATKRKTRQHSQLSQHGEFWHVSVS